MGPVAHDEVFVSLHHKQSEGFFFYMEKKKKQYVVSYVETNYIPSTICPPLKDEILDVAGKIYKAGMSLLVIDTENKFVSTGFAKEIARVAQGNFL